MDNLPRESSLDLTPSELKNLCKYLVEEVRTKLEEVVHTEFKTVAFTRNLEGELNGCAFGYGDPGEAASYHSFIPITDFFWKN